MAGLETGNGAGGNVTPEPARAEVLGSEQPQLYHRVRTTDNEQTNVVVTGDTQHVLTEHDPTAKATFSIAGAPLQLEASGEIGNAESDREPMKEHVDTSTTVTDSVGTDSQHQSSFDRASLGLPPKYHTGTAFTAHAEDYPDFSLKERKPDEGLLQPRDSTTVWTRHFTQRETFEFDEEDIFDRYQMQPLPDVDQKDPVTYLLEYKVDNSGIRQDEQGDIDTHENNTRPDHPLPGDPRNLEKSDSPKRFPRFGRGSRTDTGSEAGKDIPDSAVEIADNLHVEPSVMGDQLRQRVAELQILSQETVLTETEQYILDNGQVFADFADKDTTNERVTTESSDTKTPAKTEEIKAPTWFANAWDSILHPGTYQERKEDRMNIRLPDDPATADPAAVARRVQTTVSALQAEQDTLSSEVAKNQFPIEGARAMRNNLRVTEAATVIAGVVNGLPAVLGGEQIAQFVFGTTGGIVTDVALAATIFVTHRIARAQNNVMHKLSEPQVQNKALETQIAAQTRALGTFMRARSELAMREHMELTQREQDNNT